MAEEKPPHEEPSPLEVKPRLPFEEKQAPLHPGVKLAGIVYLAAAAMMAAAAFYFAFVQHRPLVSVPVIATALGCLYLLIRAAMVLRPKIRG